MREYRWRWGLGALAVGAGLALAGCGSPCVAKGDRIVVDVVTSTDLNNTGAGPQTVRYQVWAVKDKAMFDGARAEQLASQDGVGMYERQQMGRAFISETNWIKPADRLSVFHKVEEDEQFTHVGIAVLFPVPQKTLVPLDCDDRVGYTVEKPDHKVVFTLGKNTVELLGAKP